VHSDRRRPHGGPGAPEVCSSRAAPRSCHRSGSSTRFASAPPTSPPLRGCPTTNCRTSHGAPLQERALTADLRALRPLPDPPR